MICSYTECLMLQPKERTTTVPAEERILLSARREIKERGILGLRIMDVARGAQASLSLIYKYFSSRDGLLARVLGDLYQEIQESSLAAYMQQLNGNDNLTVEDLVRALPRFDDEVFRLNQYARLQILATSIKNPDLRARLELLTQEQMRTWREAIANLKSRMKPGEEFDDRFFLMILSTQSMYYRELLGETSFSRDDYASYVLHILKKT
jgi:AcrR family transcriptional regulator